MCRYADIPCPTCARGYADAPVFARRLTVVLRGAGISSSPSRPSVIPVKVGIHGKGLEPEGRVRRGPTSSPAHPIPGHARGCPGP